MGLMFMWRFGMWRFGFCVVALVAAPALAQTLQYDEDHSLPRHQRRHPRSLSSGDIEPFRLGPAPTGFWYRCDAPAGYYPYIPACGIPWRIVPSTPPR
jgi:hypothetical protein